MRELRVNLTKQKLHNHEIVKVPLGPFSSDLIEHFATLNIDGIWLEGEHGPVDFSNIPDLSRACDLSNLTPIVRVHQNDPGVIYRTLDLGAQGIVVPHVNSREEALAVVDASKFHPIGHRGSFTSRQGIGVENYFSKANDQTLVIVLIEDILAVNNIDEILEVDNIDVFFVAPGDLAQTMGFLGGANNPEVKQVVKSTIKKIVSKNKIAGTLSPLNEVNDFVDLGVTFIAFSWISWIQTGAKSLNENLKK